MELPVNITADRIKKLRDHINANFNAFNDAGDLDLDKCQRNVAYSAGNIYTNYNGLLMQEEQKLATIKEDLAKIKAIAYDEIKRSVLAYDVDVKGTAIMLEGHSKVSQKQKEYDDQKAYVEFLDRTVKQLSFYANAVRVMIEREHLRERYG